jgi:hypothetical protein
MARMTGTAARAETLLGQGVVSTTSVAGGDICTSTRLRLTDGHNAIIKTRPQAPTDMFTREAEGLRWLAEAGGANVPFRFGRRVQLTPDCAPPNDSCKPRDAKFASGASNHLLVSIAQAMGADTDSFGTGPDTAFTTGPLSGLT